MGTGVWLLLPIFRFFYVLRSQKPSTESISNLRTASGVVNPAVGTDTVSTSKMYLKKYRAYQYNSLSVENMVMVI